MENVIIRRMTFEDAEGVSDVLIDTWKTAYRGIVSDDVLDHQDRSQKSFMKKKGDRIEDVSVSLFR